MAVSLSIALVATIVVVVTGPGIIAGMARPIIQMARPVAVFAIMQFGHHSHYHRAQKG
jgi:hypothetical protein